MPPIEEVSIRRVEFAPGEIKLTIRNTGPMPVEMTLVTVDEAIWKAEFSPDRRLDRLQEATVRIPFDWVEGDPYKVALFTSTGLSFEKEIAVATDTPKPTARMFWIFAAMGAYVGIVPVMLGILWLPFLRGLSRHWFNFLLSLTLGLLVFLGIDALIEGFEIAARLPGAFQDLHFWRDRFSARFPRHHRFRHRGPRKGNGTRRRHRARARLHDRVRHRRS